MIMFKIDMEKPFHDAAITALQFYQRLLSGRLDSVVSLIDSGYIAKCKNVNGSTTLTLDDKQSMRDAFSKIEATRGWSDHSDYSSTLLERRVRGLEIYNFTEAFRTRKPSDLFLEKEDMLTLAQALDLFVFVLLGNFSPIDILLQTPDFPSHFPDSPWSFCQIATLLGFPHGASRGLGDRDNHEYAHAAYELYKVISQKLALQRDPNPRLRTVDYDGLTVRYTQLPPPQVEVVERSPFCVSL